MPLSDTPHYPTHPIRPSTPEAEIRAWQRANDIMMCRAFNCMLTEATCLKRRARALVAQKMVRSSSQCTHYAGDEYMALSACITCEEYPRGK